MEEEFKDLSHINFDPSKDYFIGIRHGQRADKDGKHYDDVPLTDHGIEQAQAAGQVLNELLKRSKIAQLTFIVSPFLRAMQTANEVAKECSLTDLKIDLGFMESVYGKVFTENPLLKLETRLLPMREFKEKYMYPDINFTVPTKEEWEEADKVFPEEVGDDFNRLYKGFDNVIKKYKCDDKSGSNVVVLVGHGSMVKSITDYVQPSDKIVDYCSIGAIEYDRETGDKKLVIDRFCGHIQRGDGFKLDPTLNICVI